MSLVTFLKKSSTLVSVLLIMFLAYQLALITWTFLPQDKPVLLWKPTAAKNKSDSQKINTENLQQQHLFGVKVAQAQVVQEKQPESEVTDAPLTRLKLKLVGIVAATDPNYSSVIIENKGDQNSYFIDSKIDGTSAVIEHIYQDRIIIDVKGSSQTLMLDGGDGVSKQQSKSKKLSTSRKKRTTESKRKSKTVNLDREELLKNPGKLTDYIRISPVRKDGKVTGYRVKPGKDKTIFNEAGLKSGDLAVELNGTDLTDTEQAFSLMKEFPTMTDITLSVERDGQLHELYLSIP